MESSLNFFPSYIDSRDFRYIIIDGKYVSCLSVKQFPKTSGFLEILESLPKDIEYEYTIHIDKQDTAKVLKQLTYSISSNKAEIKATGKNQVDIDILDNIDEDAKSIRREIQVNNEEIFYIAFIFCFYSSSKEELIYTIKNFQSRLYSKSIISSILNFRQLEAYLATLPLNNIDNTLFQSTYKNLTTSALSNLFPFYTRNYIDKSGILIGYIQNINRICFINTFDNKYLNANMCIFGSSGSGKSYFVKLMIIRNYFLNRKQFIIDPEGEYSTLVNKLYGEEIDIKNSKEKYYNIFQIYRFEIDENNYLDEKIDKIASFILALIGKENDNHYYKKLKIAIKDMYSNYGINEDVNTVLTDKIGNNFFLEKTIIPKEKFPCMLDLYKLIDDVKLKKELKQYVIDKYSIFCKCTNIDIYNSIISVNLKNLNLKESIVLLRYFYNILQNIDKFKQDTIIYFDEIWKYICKNDFNISSEIFSLFKTIRKKNSSIITITQDISDFFNFDNGNYGKTILNNSFFKVFFKMQYSDMKKLESLNIVDDNLVSSISDLNKGNMFLKFNYNNLLIKVTATEFEEKFLKEEKNENNCSS